VRGIDAPLRVLIVDDDLLRRWAIGRTLNDHGCTVVERADGRSATSTVSESVNPFDFILLDYHLPDSGDLGLLTRLKRLTPATKIVMMSAEMSRDEIDEAFTLGAVAFAPKPFDLDDIWTLMLKTDNLDPS